MPHDSVARMQCIQRCESAWVQACLCTMCELKMVRKQSLIASVWHCRNKTRSLKSVILLDSVPTMFCRSCLWRACEVAISSLSMCTNNMDAPCAFSVTTKNAMWYRTGANGQASRACFSPNHVSHPNMNF